MIYCKDWWFIERNENMPNMTYGWHLSTINNGCLANVWEEKGNFLLYPDGRNIYRYRIYGSLLPGQVSNNGHTMSLESAQTKILQILGARIIDSSLMHFT